jgi:hypothetical protein
VDSDLTALFDACVLFPAPLRDLLVQLALADSALSPYGIEAKHPDDFIADLIELQPLIVAGEAEVVRQRLKNPPKTFDEYTEILLKQGLPKSVTVLKELNSAI